LTRRHNYNLGYAVTKLHPQRAGLVSVAPEQEGSAFVPDANEIAPPARDADSAAQAGTRKRPRRRTRKQPLSNPAAGAA